MTDSSPVQAQNTILSAADELFADVGPEVTLADGTKVTIQTAKIRHLRDITKFIQEFAESSTAAELSELISRVSDRQKELISAGENPYLMDTTSLVKTAASEMATISNIVTSGLECFTQLIPKFTDLSAEQFEELSLADGAVVVYSIFGRNYSFFTQQALPVIRGYIATQQRLNPAKTTKKPGK